MILSQPFNQLSYEQFRDAMLAHKQYKQFNTLGMFRGIVESELLSPGQKVEIRNLAQKLFERQWEFLQIKDAICYVALYTLDLPDLLPPDEARIWEVLRHNQQQILREKRISHRSFGNYSKHNCGYDWCPYNGIMVRTDWPLAESRMIFRTDHPLYEAGQKAEKHRKNRKNWRQNKLWQHELDD